MSRTPCESRGHFAQWVATNRVLWSFGLTVLGALALVYGLDAWVDVSALGQHDLVARLAKEQQPSQLLVWAAAYDQRAWVAARLRRPGACPNILVAGSSTMGQLNGSMFPGKVLLNGWMGAPSIEDFEALTAVLSDSPCTPRVIAVGLDPWFLNANFEEERWRSLTTEYVQYNRNDGAVWAASIRARGAWERIKERLTQPALLQTLMFLYYNRHELPSVLSPRLVDLPFAAFCSTIATNYDIRWFDGHFSNCPQFIKTSGQVESAAAAYVSNNTNQIANWPEIDARRASRFATVLRRWRDKGIDVVLITPPVHPTTYRRLSDDATILRRLNSLDSTLANIAKPLGLVVERLRDPASLGCSADEFIDGHHPGSRCSAKIAQAITKVTR